MSPLQRDAAHRSGIDQNLMGAKLGGAQIQVGILVELKGAQNRLKVLAHQHHLEGDTR